MSFTTASNNFEIKTSDEMNNSLNELFNVVFDKSHCRQKPLNERHLPRSFFVPPSGSSVLSGNSHYKAFSSPATLEETYRAGAGNQINNHFKQHSLDSQNSNLHFSELGDISNIDVKSNSPQIDTTPHLDIEIKKLPPGYEMAINENCQVYFLNHTTKITTWFDPRLPESIQKWGMTLSDLQELHIQYMNMLSSRHSAAQKQPTVSLLRSQQQLRSQTDQSHNFSNSKSENHFRSISQPVSSSGASLGLNIQDSYSSTLSNFQTPTGQHMPHLKYFVNNNNGVGPLVNSYHELCHLHPNCSSVQGSRSHSNTSSCSNLSTCLNGLNLSPASLTPSHNSGNSILMTQSHYGGLISPGKSNVAHSHQDSLDSGVGQSVVSQSHLSNNVSSQSNDLNKNFDVTLKLEDSENIDSCFNDKFEEFMDVDIRSMNY